MEPAIV